MPCVYNFWVLCVFNACHCLARDRFFVHSFLFSAAIYTTENNLSIHYFVEATVVCHFARRNVDVENSVLQQSYLFLSVITLSGRCYCNPHHAFHPSSLSHAHVNHLECRGNYSAMSNETKLVNWPMAIDGWASYIWCSGEGPGRAAGPPSPLLAVPNVTAHTSTERPVYQSLYCCIMWTGRCTHAQFVKTAPVVSLVGRPN